MGPIRNSDSPLTQFVAKFRLGQLDIKFRYGVFMNLLEAFLFCGFINLFLFLNFSEGFIAIAPSHSHSLGLIFVGVFFLLFPFRAGAKWTRPPHHQHPHQHPAHQHHHLLHHLHESSWRDFGLSFGCTVRQGRTNPPPRPNHRSAALWIRSAAPGAAEARPHPGELQLHHRGEPRGAGRSKSGEPRGFDG